jgi:hypothetical protein
MHEIRSVLVWHWRTAHLRKSRSLDRLPKLHFTRLNAAPGIVSVKACAGGRNHAYEGHYEDDLFASEDHSQTR